MEPANPANSTADVNTLLAGRVLLAEDVPESSRLITWMLRRTGVSIEVVVNGREALELLSVRQSTAEPFDLLLTDIEMPEMDGYELVRQLRHQGATMPIVVLSAHDRPEDLQTARTLGANALLTKPIDKQQLIAECRKWLSAAEVRFGDNQSQSEAI